MNALDNSSHGGVLTRLYLFPIMCPIHVCEGVTAAVYTEL